MEILYKKIAQDIKNQILSGILKPDAKLPTEKELSVTYDVSRITSKKALNILQEEGLIYRLRGSGSFVKGGPKANDKDAPKTIAIVLPFHEEDTGHDITLRAIHSISNQVSQQGYHTHILFSDHDASKQSTTIAGLDNGSYLGAIIYPIQTAYNDAIYQLYAKGFPMVMMSNAIDRLGIPSVTVDNVQGGYLATEHLLEQGHESIAFLSSQPAGANHTISDRYLGYLRALRHGPLSHYSSYALTPDHYASEAIGPTLLGMILEGAVTGIVSVNDETASRFIRQAREEGLTCPHDYSIVGFDNLALCEHTYPPLTTILQDYGKMGQQAAQLLIQAIDSGDTEGTNHALTTQLILRESTRKIGDNGSEL